MGIVRELKVRAGQVAGPVIGMTMVVYFAYHAVQGDRGLIAMAQLRQDVSALQAQVLDVRDERMNLDLKVFALRSESIDPDLLEERARFLLGYGFEGEVLVITRAPVSKHAVAAKSEPLPE